MTREKIAEIIYNRARTDRHIDGERAADEILSDPFFANVAKARRIAERWKAVTELDDDAREYFPDAESALLAILRLLTEEAE